MRIRPKPLYPNKDRSIWVLFDLQDPKARSLLHDLRWELREFSDLAAFGPDYIILLIFPGAALELQR
jgi:hypothetical protein